ncbi:hypothetical protein WJX74_011025 [Apatococcus lobatus]|uniref:Solute carrier family 40 member n=1 Tax=Apatococcus lobatus TaxID=904363 RepID=A0AAW1QB93_9CHLO
MSPSPSSEDAESLLPHQAAANTGSAVALTALYCSHGLSAWGQRMWEFDVGLVLLQLQPGSLRLVSIFGLADGGLQGLLGGAVGAYIDRRPRLNAARNMYLLQNVAVGLSAVAAWLALGLQQGSQSALLFWSCVILLIALGSISSLGALGATVSVEKEWTKALCQGDSKRLSQVNAGMRRIDLSCSIAAPIAAGFLMTMASTRAAVMVISLWNAAACLPECLLLGHALKHSAALRAPKEHQKELELQALGVFSAGYTNPAAAAAAAAAGLANHPPTHSMGSHLLSAARAWLQSLWGSWRAYWTQPTFAAAIALALLYLTVLSLGLLMTAYIKDQGLTEAELAVERGLGALTGILATFTFPPMSSRLGLDRSGLIGVWAQLAVLFVTVMPAFGPASWPLHAGLGRARLLLAGLVLSRWGLWSFDLAVTQMMQERIACSQLGAVSGVQSALQSLLQSLSYIPTLVVSELNSFKWLMLASLGTVLMAALTYSIAMYMAASNGPEQGSGGDDAG